MMKRAGRFRLRFAAVSVAAMALSAGAAAASPTNAASVPIDGAPAKGTSSVRFAASANAAMETPAASRQIVPYVRIGKVKLHMTATRVRQVMGKPLSIKKERDPFADQGIDRQFSTWRYRALTVSFSGTRVNAVSTSNAKFRTRSGIRKGSTVAAVKRAYPTFTCERYTGQLNCWRSTMSGGPATSFTFKAGRVNRIMVYIESVE